MLDAVVAAAVPGGRVLRVLEGDDPRRRTVVLVRSDRGDAVVKLEPVRGDLRGEVEQGHLRALQGAGIPNVPQPLGCGRVGEWRWAVETAADGVPLAHARHWWRWRHGRSVLDALTDWLDDLAARTIHPGVAPLIDRVPLDPTVRARLPELPGAPAVLVHGDLATAGNVLVAGRRFTVIDWETAVPEGAPLVDLLPTAALALARLAGHHSPEARAGHALALCRGEAADSRWLLDRVRRHAARCNVAVDDIGSLATLAWAQQASLRLRHAELVRAAGDEPPRWVSSAELVLDAWLDDPGLGTRWEALRR